jgi:hypothetical protein
MLQTAMQRVAELPTEEQDRVASWLLEELLDEAHWDRQFAGSQDLLAELAVEARAERSAGQTTELDPDEL